MSAVPCRHVILTGVPGVGKTTLIKKACAALRNDKYRLCGFYTNEVLENGQRIGFDITTLTGAQFPLARKCGETQGRGQCMVGQYTVDVPSFEQTARDALHFEDGEVIMVIDEIGKMELFSSTFKESVKKLLEDQRVTMLATIPVMKGRPIPFVEQIRSRRDIRLLEVTKDNRNALLGEIVATAVSCSRHS